MGQVVGIGVTSAHVPAPAVEPRSAREMVEAGPEGNDSADGHRRQGDADDRGPNRYGAATGAPLERHAQTRDCTRRERPPGQQLGYRRWTPEPSVDDASRRPPRGNETDRHQQHDERRYPGG